MKKFEQRVSCVYAAGGDRDALNREYDDWAASYDADLLASGNPYLSMIAGMVGRHVADLDALALDGGCGTGLVGQILYQIGYRNIEGLDGSLTMLEEAARKGCYRRLHHLLLGERIPLPDDSYDLVVASGVLTCGHAPPEALDGMLRLAKPGAPLIFTMNEAAHDRAGFGARMRALADDGAWRLMEQTVSVRSYPYSDALAHVRHWVCVYRKAGSAPGLM